MTVPPSELPSIVTDRYAIEKQVGSGGMATVYLARDIRHDREVALKVLRPELGAVLGADRFLAEIKITARLDHPHILTLIDSGVADGLLYYVLPYVRGESLRDLLNRETQIGIDEALAYTKQVAGALDYAHRHGVIHRDIKPENILIQEGEAILADFGIALAVKEAGGSRLTETGLSLGTPQYMSPEQATGDRTLDARSDQYSLAAVLYEMLTGEPPLTGATVQAVIAKLLTEQPTRIRTIRKTVPEVVDAAVSKALAKLPADRFASAGAFARALDASRTTSGDMAGSAKSKWPMPAMIGAAVIVLAGLGAFAMRNEKAPQSAPVALRDRTQLTFTGNVRNPALSADGKQIAYFVRTCPSERCTYSVDVQDVGSTASRSVLQGATAAGFIAWSPDRRNMLLNATMNGRYGTFLVSALGGSVRYVTGGAAGFYAGGDSLLVGPIGSSDEDSSFTVKVTGLSGDVGRSIRIPGAADALASLIAVPGTSRFIALKIRGPRGLWQLVNSDGSVGDELTNSCTCGGVASGDAVWMARAGPTNSEAIVRVAMDPATGRFAAQQDTIYSGRFSGLGVTGDGSRLAVDDGTFTYAVLTLPLADAFAGKFPGVPLMTASTNVSASISPDGARILKRRSMPDASGSSATRLTVVPFDGGNETPVELEGRLFSSQWIDSVSIGIGTQTPNGLRLAVLDVRTGARRNTMDLPDSTVDAGYPLSNGWMWIPSRGDRIMISENGRQREIRKPDWYGYLTHVSLSPDGGRVLYGGWGKSTSDTIGFETVPLAGGTATRLLTSFAERASSTWLADGSVLIGIWDTPESVVLHKVSGPGQVKRLGAIPHLVGNLSVSSDLGRMIIGWREYKGDAWMYRVAKQ